MTAGLDEMFVLGDSAHFSPFWGDQGKLSYSHTCPGPLQRACLAVPLSWVWLPSCPGPVAQDADFCPVEWAE